MCDYLSLLSKLNDEVLVTWNTSYDTLGPCDLEMGSDSALSVFPKLVQNVEKRTPELEWNTLIEFVEKGILNPRLVKVMWTDEQIPAMAAKLPLFKEVSVTILGNVSQNLNMLGKNTRIRLKVTTLNIDTLDLPTLVELEAKTIEGEKFPPHLEKLTVASPGKLPGKLHSLTLSSMDVDLDDMEFPEGLRELHLKECEVEGSVPSGLQSLIFTECEIAGGVLESVPPTLEELVLDNVEIDTDYSRLQNGDETIEAMVIRMPELPILKTLDVRVLGKVVFEQFRFPETLERLVGNPHAFSMAGNSPDLKRPQGLRQLRWIQSPSDSPSRSLSNTIMSLPITLHKLDLSWCKLEKVNVTHLASLEELDLSSNNISRIEHVEWPKSLKKLNLSSNKVTQLTPVNLSELCVRGNKIKEIGSEYQQSRLAKLDITRNEIVSLDLGSLPQLTVLKGEFQKVTGSPPSTLIAAIIVPFGCSGWPVPHLEVIQDVFEKRGVSVNNLKLSMVADHGEMGVYHGFFFEDGDDLHFAMVREHEKIDVFSHHHGMLTEGL